MDRNQQMWVLECCVLRIDGHTKEQMIGFGCPKELADMGIQLHEYLLKKNLMGVIQIDGY